MSTRTRSSGSVTTQVFGGPAIFKRYYVEYYPYPPWTYYGLYIDNYETAGPFTCGWDDRCSITDSVGERYSFNSCTHTRRIPISVSFPQIQYDGRDVTQSWLIDGIKWHHYYLHSVELPHVAGKISVQGVKGSDIVPYEFSTSIDWTTLTQNVGSQLDGHMQEGQNLIVSLMQVSQTLGMLRNPFGLARLARAMPRLSLGRIIRSTANNYLEYRFGWQPLLNDVKALASVMKEVKAHQEYLKQTAGKSVRIAARHVDTAYPPSSPQPIATITTGNLSYHVYHTHDVRTSTFSLHTIREETALHISNFSLMMDRLGGNDLVGALWDAVPFSFVVDWFIHFNRLLNWRPYMWNSSHLVRMGHSVKIESYCTVKRMFSYAFDNGWYGYDFNDYGCGASLAQCTYQRTAGFPTGCAQAGFFGSLNQTQLATLGALIVQRM